jgi:hypothetical protein
MRGKDVSMMADHRNQELLNKKGPPADPESTDQEL